MKAGDCVFAPRNIPHTFAKISEGDGRLLIVYQPAGTIEAFFHEASLVKNPTQEDFIKLFKAHGMEIVGPPLPVTE